MPRIFRGPAGGRKGRAMGKWDEKRQPPPKTAIHECCSKCGQMINPSSRYETEVHWVVQTLKTRGRIYEGCRPAFEAGEYKDENLKRMIDEGVIVPARDPNGGYVLPAQPTANQPDT